VIEDPMPALTPGRLLSGVRILDLTHFLAGPYCTMLLADLGAEVVKVERPTTGDPARARGPFGRSETGKQIATGFLGPNRNKRSLTLNLKAAEAGAIMQRLVPHFDVVVENMSAGTLNRLGFGYEFIRKVNPRAVLVSISGYGQPGTSPYADLPAFGPIAEALSGFTARTGGRSGKPMFTGIPLADTLTGAYAAFATLAALIGARSSGVGCHVDVSQYDCLVSQMERLLLFWETQHLELPPGSERNWLPTGVVEALDGYVMYAAVSEEYFQTLARLVGAEEVLADPRLHTPRDREEHLTDLFSPRVESWANGRTRAEIVATLRSAGIPVAPVHGIRDVYEDDNLRARSMFIEIDHEAEGRASYVGNPVKVNGVMRAREESAPPMGRDTEAILREVAGATESEIGAWRESGAI
jgi:crotonobetainyl-CoA:carnitine CoA-transferase CaiB-like acyl-CoA transferase